MLRQVKGIIATYRMTNRPLPSRHSPYVTSVLQPLKVPAWLFYFLSVPPFLVSNSCCFSAMSHFVLSFYRHLSIAFLLHPIFLPEGLVICQTRLVLKRKDRLIFKRVSLLSMVNFSFFISQTFVEDERFAHLTKEMRAELILSVSEKITVTYDVLARDMVSVVRITFSKCH